jgi:DNA polymerase
MTEPHMMVRDIETRSTVDLKKVGLHNYACHPSTTVMCIGHCVDNVPVRMWHPGEPVPHEYHTAAKHGWTMVAHNAPFEMAIERHILGPRYGFPAIPIERNVCTMAIANALALPASLDKLAKVLDLKHQKDKIGSRIMLQMAKPRRARKNEIPEAVYWFEDVERLSKLDVYCADDVLTTREIALQLPWLSDDEYQIWLLDQKINNRGIFVDEELALAARRIAQSAAPFIDNEISRITDGRVVSINRIADLKAWLANYAIDVDSLDKASIEELLERDDLPDNAREAIGLRYLGAQAAVKKVDALLAHRNSTGRVYDSFVYHAAGPGRWSSRGIQLHNMKRSTTEDLEKAVKVIGTGSFDKARKEYDNPLSVIGDLIRAMIIAAPGHTLIGADFSGIEARITAWLAGEESKLKVFRDFDAGIGPDPYLVSAARIYGVDVNQLAADFKAGKSEARERRQVGKASELAFGFQGGVNAYRKFTPSGSKAVETTAQSVWDKRHGKVRSGGETSNMTSTDFTDAQIHRIKTAWRKAHPNIEAMWQTLSNAAWKTTRTPGVVICYRDKLKFEHDGSSLWITLPSDRKLHYPEARIARFFTPPDSGLIIETPKGSQIGILFKDNASGQWRDVKIYGGLLTENVVQATARDLLAHAMLRIEAAGMPIVAHVHDEAISEVSEAKIKRLLPQFQRLMVESPDWATGLPIIAKPWSASRYVK